MEEFCKDLRYDVRTIPALQRARLCHQNGAPPDLRDARELLRYRISMVQARTALINYTHGLLDKYDVMPDVSKMHTKKAIRLLSQIRLEKPNDNMILQNCVKRIAHATEDISGIEDEIGRQAAVNENAKLLMSMTGIETFAAMLLVSEIGDITRFKTADRLVSWAGMCPRVYQSGNVTHHGHMKKASNRRVNWIMIQAANVAVRHDDRLTLFYQRAKIRHSCNHPIAITHVVNKMIRIIWKMLTAKEPYESRNKDRYARKMERMKKVLQ